MRLAREATRQRPDFVGAYRVLTAAAAMAGEIELAKASIKEIGRVSRKRHDIGSHPHGLGVDINPNDARVWHCHGCTDDETSLRAGASRAVHDGGRREAQ